MPEIIGTHTVFSSVAQAHRKKLNQSLRLPDSVKAILQCPEDELSWRGLENLRRAICRTIQGECEVSFDNRNEIDKLAEAIESCKSAKFADEVGAGSQKCFSRHARSN